MTDTGHGVRLGPDTGNGIVLQCDGDQANVTDQFESLNHNCFGRPIVDDLNLGSSDTEGTSDCESSRVGLIDYYPARAHAHYDNRKTLTDTIERCITNNDAAFDCAIDAGSDISSLDSPRDESSINDSARMNPRVDSCIIDMPPDTVMAATGASSVTSSARMGQMYDEEIMVSDNEEELDGVSIHEKLYRSEMYQSEKMSYDDDADLEAELSRRQRRQREKSDNESGTELTTLRSWPSERHLEATERPQFQTADEALGSAVTLLSYKRLPEPVGMPAGRPVGAHNSEDSKSSEDSSKQDLMKKKRKKRKTKSKYSLLIYFYFLPMAFIS